MIHLQTTRDDSSSKESFGLSYHRYCLYLTVCCLHTQYRSNGINGPSRFSSEGQISDAASGMSRHRKGQMTFLPPFASDSRQLLALCLTVLDRDQCDWWPCRLKVEINDGLQVGPQAMGTLADAGHLSR
jgi:hypothetical protein